MVKILLLMIMAAVTTAAQAMNYTIDEQDLRMMLGQKPVGEQIAFAERLMSIFFLKNDWTEKATCAFVKMCKVTLLLDEQKAKGWVARATAICPISAFRMIVHPLPLIMCYGCDEENNSLIHKAYGSPDCREKLELLVEKGIDLSAKNKKGITLYKLAADKEDWDVQDIVMQQIIAKRNKELPHDFCRRNKRQRAVPFTLEEKSAKRSHHASGMSDAREA